MLTDVRVRADVFRVAIAFVFVAAQTFLPIEVAAQSSPSLTVTSTTVSPGATVYVTVANGPGGATDWVGMFPTSAGDSGYLSNWVYLSGSRTPPSNGLTHATLTFAVPNTIGTFDLRFFSNNLTTKLATSAAITATTGGAPPSVRVTPTTISPGGVATVTVANGPGNALDWVASYLTDAPDSSYIEWQYLNSSRTPPGVAVVGGILTFTMPTTPGSYQLRFFSNNSHTLLATSNTVTVGGSPTRRRL
jgi:hypothetical protein